MNKIIIIGNLTRAPDEANSGDYSYMSCGSVSAEVGEFLDCMQDKERNKQAV